MMSEKEREEYEETCKYNMEYIINSIDQIEWVVKEIEKGIKTQEEKKRIYEWLENTHGLVVTYPKDYILDKGYLNPETEDEEELMNDQSLYEEYCKENILLRIETLLIYLNYCLRWLTRVAKPKGWKWYEGDYEDICNERRHVINMYNKLSPERYEEFLEIETEMKEYPYWDPKDNYEVPSRYITIKVEMKKPEGRKEEIIN